MKRFRNMRLPSAAMIVAVIALVLALGGTGFAAKKLLKLGAFSDGAKNKTVGVGKLTYVSTTINVPVTPGTDVQAVSASCPSGQNAIGGGIKLGTVPEPEDYYITDGYLTTTGYTGHVDNNEVASTATVAVACANSRAVTGTPPTS
jgi:hypothetical protein